MILVISSPQNMIVKCCSCFLWIKSHGLQRTIVYISKYHPTIFCQLASICILEKKLSNFQSPIYTKKVGSYMYLFLQILTSYMQIAKVLFSPGLSRLDCKTESWWSFHLTLLRSCETIENIYIGFWLRFLPQTSYNAYNFLSEKKTCSLLLQIGKKKRN